jgi:hypothetical protein
MPEWGLVNLFEVIYIVNHHQLKLPNPLSLLQQLDYQWHAEKMIFMNIGLDLFFYGDRDCYVDLWIYLPAPIPRT